MKLALLIVALLAPVAFGQTDLPTMSTIAEIRGKTKYYVIAGADDREKIIKVLKKRPELEAVGSPDDAEFFVEYHQGQANSVAYMHFAKGQMDVFVKRDGKKIVAWSETATGGAFKSAIAGELAGKLVKALKKGEG